MARLFKGAEVNEKLNARVMGDVEALKAKGVVPTLGIIRIGERPDDISYEKGATKRAETLGVEIKKCVLPADVSKEDLIKVIRDTNADTSIHGVLLFRPFPEHLVADSEEICNELAAEKDIDCITNLSYAGMFTGKELGFNPCTPQAVCEILDHYGIDVKGKKVTVVGCSLVVGKPLASMLIERWATVQVCHIFTKDVPAACREADIVIFAAGKAKLGQVGHFREGQIVIDVGINWNEETQKICGDVDFENVEPIVEAITPVPGGVGTVTTSVLISHVVEAAKRI